ncbi:SDR family NAD(P)-dependent oxidoreductase, partial [Staphylococcus aureus]
AILGTVESLSFADWQKTLGANLDGVYLGTQLALPHLKAAGGGAIINIASIEGLIGEAQLPAYNASKGAVRLLSRSTAIHCA